MTVNIKISILFVMISIIVVLNLLSHNSIKTLASVKQSTIELTTQLNTIKSIKSYYGVKSNNKKRFNRMLKSYTKNIVFSKDDKNTKEFKMTNLNSKKLDFLLKNLINKGFKILYLNVTRVDANKAMLNCKVLF